MENYLVVIALVLLGIAYLAFQYFLNQQKKLSEIDQYKAAYYLKDSLMNKSEYLFFKELERQLSSGYHLFTKVRIEDFIGVRKKIERPAHFRGYIQSRHLDFLVCDEHMEPVLAVELDGGSHKMAKTIEIDARKDLICEAVGLRLERVRVGSDFTAEANRVKNVITMTDVISISPSI